MAKKRRHIALVKKLATGKPSTLSLTKSEIKELSSFELPNGSPTIVNTQEAVAKIFGVTVRTIQYWIREGMPVTNEDTYDLIDIRAWRFTRMKKNKKNQGNEKKDWEQIYREMKARLAELELKKALKEYVPIEDIQRELFIYCTIIKQRMLSLPTQIAPQLIGLDVKQIYALLSERIREIIGGFVSMKIEVYGKKKVDIVIRSIK